MHLIHNSPAPVETVDPADARHRYEWVSRARLAAVSRVGFLREQPAAGFELQLPYLVRNHER